MKKFFSLVLALVMALSLTTIAWGATTHEVSTEDQLAELLDEDGTNDVAEGDTIKLLNSIQVQNAMHTSGTSTNGVSYTGGKSFTIDFNNCSVSAGSSINNAIFRIKTSGTVTLMNGTITASDVYYGVLANGTGTINLDNMTISLTNTGGQGVAVNAYAGTVNVNDGTEITATGAYAGMEVSGTANIYEGSTVSYVGNVPTPNTYGSIGSAVGTSGGTLNIYGGELVSTATGGNTVATNSSGGTINITGGTITGETAVFALTDSHYNLPAEINISGGTINGALAETAYGTASTEVTVSGGIFDRDVTTYLATGYETAEVGSTGGTFVVGQDIEVDAGKITAGTFTDDVSAYVAAGYTVVGGEIVKASNSYTGLYAGATSEGANVVAITSLNFFKANDNEVNEDGTYKADGNVAYYTVTGDQYFSGKYYVEVKTLAKADVVVYTDAAGKNVYMYLDQIEDPFYYGDGVVTKNFGTACGQYNAKNPAYDKKATYYVAFETLYVGDKVSPTEWLMVNGEMVGVDVAFDDVVAHAPVYTRDEDGEIVAIKCSKCGAVAVEAPNFLSMPKNADRVGTTLWYFPAAGAVVDTDTKVESAETFDAGIAMYVGMSVMAAAGSAVVLKKRED